ncbi:MAG: hypothetical protein M1840_007445 [Geoglossum simile]|nr:MAG: hypothetical protein M1840_007445 [Geoglossum simile]
MVDVRRVRPSWFRGQSGDVWRETPPAFVKGECDDFNFDAAQVFNRFSGEGSWDRWLQDGTLILSDIFGHLRGVETEIHSEFDIGPQQLIYQDPILRALTASARTDKHWRLIAYPYITKNAATSQKTGFLHLDLDLKRCQTEGLGKNMVQSSVSLTDENDKGCTLVIPGFHKCFQEWVSSNQDVIDTKVSRHSNTDMKGMYTVEDRVVFGKPVPTPCPAWGIRLSRSDIIHGSTDEGTRLRLVIFPSFTAINDDHKLMENPDCMNWEELFSCHNDLVCLPQALVGLKEWTEPDVIFERNILLGPDDNRAPKLAENIRKQLVDSYKPLHPLMEIEERHAFGDRSPFVENNVARGEDEDVELDEDRDDEEESERVSHSNGQDV